MSAPRPADALQRFLRAWMPELAKSVEMFTGAAPAVEADSGPRPAASAGAPMTWLAQSFERNGTGELWIGTPSPAVAALLEPAGVEPGEYATLFQELLRQSLRGAAHVLGTEGCTGLACMDACHAEPPPPSLETAAVWLAAGGGERVRLEVAASPEFAALLDVGAPDESGRDDIAETAGDGGGTFERFSGVDLPVAIVLGRATMCIGDVLKLGVGSLVELDRHAGDPVEICVNDAVIARGQVVSIRGNYGVRVLEVLTPRERMRLRSGASRPSGTAGERPQVH